MELTLSHSLIYDRFYFSYPLPLLKHSKLQTTLSAKVLKQRIESGKRLQRLKAKKGGK